MKKESILIFFLVLFVFFYILFYQLAQPLVVLEKVWGADNSGHILVGVLLYEGREEVNLSPEWWEENKEEWQGQVETQWVSPERLNN